MIWRDMDESRLCTYPRFCDLKWHPDNGKTARLTSRSRLRLPIDLRLHTPQFTVLHETDDFMLVDKPAHLLVHPSVPGNPPTLLDGLEALCIYELANGGKLSLINRLDRETSGIVLVAKTKEAARELSIAMEKREFRKSYHALVWGWPKEDQFTVEEPIRRKGEVEDSPIWVKQIVDPDGKPSLTRFEVERRFEKRTSNGNRFALLRCYPATGRMHQIRVHAAHSGHSIVGDKIYGPDDACYLQFIETGWTSSLERQLLMNRQALHASGFGWKGEDWECSLPLDMSNFLGE